MNQGNIMINMSPLKKSTLKMRFDILEIGFLLARIFEISLYAKLHRLIGLKLDGLQGKV